MKINIDDMFKEVDRFKDNTSKIEEISKGLLSSVNDINEIKSDVMSSNKMLNDAVGNINSKISDEIIFFNTSMEENIINTRELLTQLGSVAEEQQSINTLNSNKFFEGLTIDFGKYFEYTKTVEENIKELIIHNNNELINNMNDAIRPTEAILNDMIGNILKELKEKIANEMTIILNEYNEKLVQVSDDALQMFALSKNKLAVEIEGMSNQILSLVKDVKETAKIDLTKSKEVLRLNIIFFGMILVFIILIFIMVL